MSCLATKFDQFFLQNDYKIINFGVVAVGHLDFLKLLKVNSNTQYFQLLFETIKS
jgi:hypothetical protein